MEFLHAEYSTDHSALFRFSEFALSVAVVDTRSLAGARNHCKGSERCSICCQRKCHILKQWSYVCVFRLV
jgi:hypothetical protein